jgi:hypothetical protein
MDTKIQRYKESKDKGKRISKLGTEFYGMKNGSQWKRNKALEPVPKTNDDDIELNQNQLSEMRHE